MGVLAGNGNYSIESSEMNSPSQDVRGTPDEKFLVSFLSNLLTRVRIQMRIPGHSRGSDSSCILTGTGWAQEQPMRRC